MSNFKVSPLREINLRIYQSLEPMSLWSERKNSSLLLPGRIIRKRTLPKAKIYIRNYSQKKLVSIRKLRFQT